MVYTMHGWVMWHIQHTRICIVQDIREESDALDVLD